MGAAQPRAARWNVNLILILAGAAIIAASAVIQLVLLPSSFLDTLPLWVGAVIGAALVLWKPRPWAYLVAGILVSLFPLVVVFVFGALDAIRHPGGGIESAEVTSWPVGATLALLGGIMGFVQGRRDAHPPADRAGLVSWQALTAIVVVGMFIGWATANGYATIDVRDNLERSVHVVESVDKRIQVVTTGVAFAPRPIAINAGELTALDIENGDPFIHTFSYHLADGIHQTIVPANSEFTIYVKFDTPQTIHVWCAPHSGGEADRAPESMWTDMVVA